MSGEHLDIVLMTRHLLFKQKIVKIKCLFQLWKTVIESDRRDIYEDVVFNLAKKEKDEKKAMRKRNMKVIFFSNGKGLI